MTNITQIELVIGRNFDCHIKVKLFKWKKGVAMILCRSMGSVASEE